MSLKQLKMKNQRTLNKNKGLIMYYFKQRSKLQSSVTKTNASFSVCGTLFFILALTLFSCIKEPLAPKPVKVQDTIKQTKPDTSKQTTIDTIKRIKTATTYNKGIYILNEGLNNQNNASLSFYSLKDSIAQTDYFDIINGRKLGDLGNDIKIYGGKVYIVVSISSQVEVLDLLTGKSIKQIPIFNSIKPRQVRKIAFCKNKAFVCSFDGTVEVIDTASLQIENIIKVGRNPDGIAVVGNKIYVANSGGLDNPNYDKTVSVIDFATLTETKRIPVQINPTYMNTDKYGNVYVVSRGNYTDVKMRLQIIDSKTDSVTKLFTEFEALNLAIKGDTAYVYCYDFTGATGSTILLLNVTNQSIIRKNFITDNTKIETVYGIAVHPTTGDVFITDAHAYTKTGEVFCFTAAGKKKYSFKVGLLPSCMVFF